MWKGKEVELRGMKPLVHRLVQDKNMEREIKRRRCGWICLIRPLNVGLIMEGNLSTIVLGTQQKGLGPTEQQLLSILDSFTNLFGESQGLPPNRSHDHQFSYNRVVVQPT